MLIEPKPVDGIHVNRQKDSKAPIKMYLMPTKKENKWAWRLKGIISSFLMWFELKLSNTSNSSYLPLFLFCFFTHLKVDSSLLLISRFKISAQHTGERKNLLDIPGILYHTLKNRIKCDLWNVWRIHCAQAIFFMWNSLENLPLSQEVNSRWAELSEMILLLANWICFQIGQETELQTWELKLFLSIETPI